MMSTETPQETRWIEKMISGDGDFPFPKKGSPWIVAEVGSNYRDLADCMNAVNLAKNCGATHVKFQHFSKRDLYGRDCFSTDRQIPLDWVIKLKEKADAAGIGFICSTFSVEGIKALDPYVSVHKVASAEAVHIEMLQELAKIGKPVIISTGGCNPGDLMPARSILAGVPLILAYCVSNYPAWDINLDYYLDLASFGVHQRDYCMFAMGFSDHTLDRGWLSHFIAGLPSFSACAYFEKHVNFCGIEDSPDAPHSLNTDQFKIYCSRITGFSDNRQTMPEEQPFIERHKRRLIATQNIAEGEAFLLNKNYGIYRSTTPDRNGLQAALCYEIHEKRAAKPIAKGSPIAGTDILK